MEAATNIQRPVYGLILHCFFDELDFITMLLRMLFSVLGTFGIELWSPFQYAIDNTKLQSFLGCGREIQLGASATTEEATNPS